MSYYILLQCIWKLIISTVAFTRKIKNKNRSVVSENRSTKKERKKKKQKGKEKTNTNWVFNGVKDDILMLLIRTGQYPLVRITTEKNSQISQKEWKALTLYTEHCNVKKKYF